MSSRGARGRGAARAEKANSNSDTAENQNSPCGGVTNNTRGENNHRGDNKLASRSGIDEVAHSIVGADDSLSLYRRLCCLRDVTTAGSSANTGS